MNLKKFAHSIFLLTVINAHAMEPRKNEIQEKFDLLFTMHLELMRDKLKEVFILLPKRATSPIELVYQLEDIIPMIKVLQKNRFAFHIFIKKKQHEENFTQIIDPLVSNILDLREEINGYYLEIKRKFLTSYSLPLEYEILIKQAFGLLDLLLTEFNYPTPQLMKESKKRIKDKNDEILAQWESL
jgi:hypothetical protein